MHGRFPRFPAFSVHMLHKLHAFADGVFEAALSPLSTELSTKKAVKTLAVLENRLLTVDNFSTVQKFSTLSTELSTAVIPMIIQQFSTAKMKII